MTKEEKIKDAYGSYYEDIRLCIDKDGFCELGQKEDNDWGVEPFLNKEELEIVPLDSYYFKWRPKSLSGIENNNGWIKIESKEKMPIENLNCYIDLGNNDVRLGEWFITKNTFGGFFDNRGNSYFLDEIEAYLPINKPNPRIY